MRRVLRPLRVLGVLQATILVMEMLGVLVLVRAALMTMLAMVLMITVLVLQILLLILLPSIVHPLIARWILAAHVDGAVVFWPGSIL